MSSSQPFVQSSPMVDGPTRRKSRFTYKHLAQLGLGSSACPLRVIAHVDLDGFYAQCELVRLGLPEETPLAVQQWQGLIAINYPAKAFGLTRHVNIMEAKKLCPELVIQHVATWREGDERWAYHDDAFKNMATHKVSLDPYRLESRKILATIKDVLPAPPAQRVEKAGIDEVFLDLSIQVHSILLSRYPVLSGPIPYDDPSEHLPSPPTTALQWDTDGLVDLDTTESEKDDPDWDDIVMLLGSEIVRSVRAAIRDRLKYTCSAGIAQNKMLAKLGSAKNKPNKQTIIRNRAIQHFLSDFKFTKIRNLGGKLGDQVVSIFETDTVKDLLEISLDQLKLRLGDDTGSWIYHVIRGEDHSEVSPNTQIKSMLSAKSFRPSINTFEQGVRWLRIFVADIFSRLVEEGVLENRRRPRTITLHHRSGGQTRSRQVPIPQGRQIDEALLFDLAKTLLGQAILQGNTWPCANLSLSVGGFEDAITGNLDIGAFLVRGEEAIAMKATTPEPGNPSEITGPSGKRRKLGGKSIQRFFPSRESTTDDSDDPSGYSDGLKSQDVPSDTLREDPPQRPNEDHEALTLHQETLERFFCPACKEFVPLHEKEEHDDWHFAMDLQAEDTIAREPPARPGSANSITRPKASSARQLLKTAPRKGAAATSNARSSTVRLEKGQRKLGFGQ